MFKLSLFPKSVLRFEIEEIEESLQVLIRQFRYNLAEFILVDTPIIINFQSSLLIEKETKYVKGRNFAAVEENNKIWREFILVDPVF